MASDGRYMYYEYPYATPPSYEPQRPIRSDSGSSSSQPPHSPVQQPQHHSSHQQFSTHSHSRPQPSYPAPPQQQYAPAPTYMSPAAVTPPQQWTQSSWGQQSYAPPPPPSDTPQYNTVPPPPVRPPSNEHQQRVWNHPSYAPPPPPPPLGYSPPPARQRSDEPQQRLYAPPPLPPPDSPNPRQSHGHGHPPPMHPSYRQSQSHHPPPHPPPHPSPPQAVSQRTSRRRDSTPAPHPAPAPIPEPTPEPVTYTPYSPPANNPIDFNRLAHSYHMILDAGKTLAVPRGTGGAVDRMLENAFHAAQVLEDASAGNPHASQHQHQHQHQHQSKPPPPPVVRAAPVAVQPSSVQYRPQAQVQRIHSASTVSSVSDTGRARAPNYSQPPTRSPPGPSTSVDARVKDISPREGKAKIKITSPGNGKGTPGLHVHAHGGGSDGPPVVSSPSKPKSQKFDDSGHAPAGGDSSATGSARSQDAHHSSGGTAQKCLGCGATATPEWRRGPLGPRTLCNACGLVYAKLVKKRMREDARAGGGTRAANGYGGRGQGPRGESPEAQSDEDDEPSYDHGHIPGR